MSLEFVRLKLERWAFIGPVYTVTVAANGAVEWEGRHLVAAQGQRSWQITEADVMKIVEALREAGFRDFRDAYDEPAVTDRGGVRMTVELADGGSKTVLDNHGHIYEKRLEHTMKKLRALEDRIEQLLGTKPYVGDELRRRYGPKT